MSIALTAPEKFDFQDAVSAQFALRFFTVADRLLVEPAGGEDATLALSGTQRPHVFEIQVKGATGSFGIADLAEHLFHFPDRQHEGGLFERLAADEDRAVVFVITARCDDATAKYVMPSTWSGELHKEGRFQQADAIALIDELKRVPTTDPLSELQKRRVATRVKIAAALEPKKLLPLLRRTIILEKITREAVEADCERVLRTDFRLPQDALTGAIARIRSAIKSAKQERADALPLVRRELQAMARTSVKSSDYVERGDEAAIASQLSQQRMLLLSGATRTGKTELARRIASDFQTQGYDVQEFSEADAAFRYLADTIPYPRLAVLDDPLGSIIAKPDAVRTLNRIQDFAHRLPPNRRLIVSQSQEQLFFATKRDSLKDIPMLGVAWLDAGQLTAEFLERIWRSLAKTYGRPEEPLAHALRMGTVVLAPGSLRHLALSYDRVRDSAKLGDLVTLAREDANTLSWTLAQSPDMEQLLAALSVGTRADQPVAEAELAFLLGAGGATLPGKPDGPILGAMKVGGSRHPAPPLPQYETKPALTDASARALEILERLQIVTRAADGAINFSHPFYRAAGELVFDHATARMGDVAAHLAQRGLFCGAARTTRATAKNLEWLAMRLAQLNKFRAAVIVLAIDGLESYFPGTRDLCLQFLIRHLDLCTLDQQQELPHWVAKVSSVELHDLRWAHGEAHLPVDGFTDASEYIDRLLVDVEAKDIQAELNALQGESDVSLTPEQVLKPLYHFAQHSDRLNAQSAGRLLSLDEAVIRAETARLWLSIPREDDDTILNRIFSDDHPSVLEAAFEGIIRGWEYWPQERRDEIARRLQAAASATAPAAALLDKLVVFDRVEYTGENPPWILYGTLLPTVIRALPLTAWVHDARLYASMQSAVRELPAVAVLSICDAWLDWVQKNLDDQRLLSDFSLGTADFVIAATRDSPDLRGDRIAKLLAFEETGTLLVFLKDLIDEWDNLTEEERAIVLQKLSQPRRDLRWLQAVALTRRHVPNDVEQAIFGSDMRLAQGVSALMSHMEPGLFAACVSIQCGRPQPFWALGIHHSDAQIWVDVVKELVRHPERPEFSIALEDRIYDSEDELISASIREMDVSFVDAVFDLLLRQRILWTGNWLPKSWAALLARASEANRRADCFARMDDAVPAILDDLSDLKAWLTTENDLLELFQRLPEDADTRRFIREIGRDVQPGDADATIRGILRNVVQELWSARQPRLHGTCSELTDFLRGYGVTEKTLLAQIEEHRLRILQLVKELRDNAKPDLPPPTDWVGPN